MIQFFGTRSHHGLVCDFLDSWAPAARQHIRTRAYGRFPVWQSFPAGAVVFSDLERLRPEEMPLAIRLAKALSTQPQTYRVLNHPGHYAGRFQLLKILEANHINNYRVRRADESHQDLNFPVFVRHEANHDGPATPLLHSLAELRNALSRPEFQDPIVRRQLMVVEYCDCVRDGIFRKYSAMKVGDTIIPRHVLFSDQWSTKTPDLVTAESVQEEREFFFDFPHAEQVEKTFRLAGLDYGRIDYGFSRGKIQVWEINTNPTVVPLRKKIDPRRMPVQSESARRIVEAILNLSPLDQPIAAHPFRKPYFFRFKIKQFFRFRRRDNRR
jgi:hypothetical protein